MKNHFFSSNNNILFFLFLFALPTLRSQYLPINTFSITLNHQVLNKSLIQSKMRIDHPLKLNEEELSGCKVIGSISQINLIDNPNLEFNFVYKLWPNNSTLMIDIYAKNQDEKPLGPNLLIVLDFILAKFPAQFEIRKFNMTSYQEHLTFENGFSYQMLMFLNGFNNLSLSGGVTYSYQDGADIYTVHYMSKVGEKMNMGWREGQDYILYTIAIVPLQFAVQKFRLLGKTFSIDYPKGSKYFYGIKGSVQQQFVGSFSERPGGIKFSVQKLGINKTYGLAFLSFPDLKFLDQRNHKSSNILQTLIIIASGSIIVCFFICIIFRKRINSLLFDESNRMNEESDFSISQISQATKNDERNSDNSRQKYQINTVAEVQQKYQVSRRPSYGNSRDLKEPELALQQ